MGLCCCVVSLNWTCSAKLSRVVVVVVVRESVAFITPPPPPPPHTTEKKVRGLSSFALSLAARKTEREGGEREGEREGGNCCFHFYTSSYVCSLSLSLSNSAGVVVLLLLESLEAALLGESGGYRIGRSCCLVPPPPPPGCEMSQTGLACVCVLCTEVQNAQLESQDNWDCVTGVSINRLLTIKGYIVVHTEPV